MVIPTEAEQIKTIDQAESAAFAPFAFSVPQEVTDRFLMLGSNTEQHRMAVVLEFMKHKSAEQIAEELREIFYGGNGLTVDGKRYAIWYTEEGLRMAAGTSARYIGTAQTLSWENAARRIGKLLEEGQFATASELTEAPGYERRQLSKRLWNLRHDFSEAAASQGFLPSLSELSGGDFSEETARLAEKLTDTSFCENLDDELTVFRNAYQSNRGLLRFHNHRTDDLLTRLEELLLPRRSYISGLSQLPEMEGFITEDEINEVLAAGSLVSGSQQRIADYWQQVHTSREKVDFLKKEYGIGGRSHALSGAAHSEESHDSKGIRLRKPPCPEVRLSWIRVAERIDELIRKDRYVAQKQTEQAKVPPALGEAEKADEPFDTAYIRQQLTEKGIVNGEVVAPEKLATSPAVQAAETIAKAVEQQEDAAFFTSPSAYQTGDTVYLDGKPFDITEIRQNEVQLLDKTLVYPIFRVEPRQMFERLLTLDERNLAVLSQLDESTPPLTQKEESVAPVVENGLPYDVVIERLYTEPPAQEQESPALRVRNFRIMDNHLGEGGPKAKFRANMDAIHLLHELELDDRQATPEEQETLSRYVGWGSLPEVFDNTRSDWHEEYEELVAILSPQEYAAARASTLNAHYTSPTVIRAIYDAVEQMGFTSGNILEIKVAC